jgi:hypothetical protein
MTPYLNHDDEMLALFLRSQNLLHIVDNRMQPLEPRDMETLAKLCGLVEQNNPGDTPIALALTRLACTTAAVLTTSVVDAEDNPQIIAEWRSAGDEYEALSN